MRVPQTVEYGDFARECDLDVYEWLLSHTDYDSYEWLRSHTDYDSYEWGGSHTPSR